ncbi:MAG: hypothetical protein JWM64_430, partial [Frankiales bacterium]|nr:hypothetical protein [Frankiales bacterium]
MASWDRRTPAQQRSTAEAAVRAQVVDAVGPFSPWWRERFAALGRSPSAVATVQGLAELPAVGERDLCPDGDPKGAAALVLQAGERGFALHASGPVLRRALAQRLVAPGGYRATVEADTRPTSFVFGGLGVRFPVASTRGDLDVLARAGARLWQVLGLSGSDVLVAGLPTRPSAALQALQLAALGAGAPAAYPGDDPDDLVEALRLLPATVLALPTGTAAVALDELAAAGAPLATVSLLLLVGAPTDVERASALEALQAAGASRAQVLAVHAASGHRLLWAECRQSAGRPAGLHTSPDLELVQLVDPETGLAGRGGGPAETVVTQLGLRGSALLRWRTGDLADAVQEGACPACGRTVPRVVGLRRRALVPLLALREGERAVDLRSVTAVLAGRRDVADWRVVLTRSRRSGADQLLVHVTTAPGTEPGDAVVAVAADVRAACGVLPSQVVVAPSGGLPGTGTPLSRRVLLQGE